MLLSLRTMLSRERATGIDAVIGFRFGHESYRRNLTPDGLTYARGDTDNANVIFSGEWRQQFTAACRLRILKLQVFSP